MKKDQSARGQHPPIDVLASYCLARCTQEQAALVDDHAWVCEECRMQIGIMLRICMDEVHEEEKRNLRLLFPLGAEALAEVLRREAGHMEEVARSNNLSSSKSQSSNSSERWRLSDLWNIAFLKRALLPPVIAAVIVACAFSLWVWWQRSPVQTGMTALRQSYPISRPIEARITGAFPYKPYEPTRGESTDNRELNRDQLTYALTQLTAAVASQPSADAHHTLGRLYLLTRDFKQAEEQLTSALNYSKRNARIHADLAALYYERSKFEEPSSLLIKAIDHYDNAIDIEPRLAEAWFNRALCYQKMALPTKARADWEQYLKLDPDSPWALEARERLKELQSRANQSPGQTEMDKLTVKAAIEANDENEMRRSVSHHFVASTQFVTGELFDEYLNAAVKGDEAAANKQLTALRRIGNLTVEIKGDRYVADLVDFAARASPSVKQGIQRVRLVLRQADELFNRGSLDAPFNLYSSAHREAERIGDQCHAEIAAFSLTRYSNLRTNSEPLASLGDRLIAETGRRQHRQLHALSLLAMANAYAGSQQISRALEHSLRAANIARELGDNETAITGLRFAGAAYSRAGDYNQAVARNFEAVSLMQKYSVAPIKAAQVYGHMGDTLYRTGNYNRAIDYQLESLRQANQSSNNMFIAGILGRVGLTNWKLGRDEEAMKYLNDAIAYAKPITDRVSRSILQIDLYTALGDFYLHRHDVGEAILAYQRAKNTISDTNNRVFLSAIHQGLATAYLAQGKIAEAEAEFQTSIRLAERDRRQINDVYGRSLFLASRQKIYHAMIDFQLNSKRDPLQGFNYSEIAKSRELLDVLNERDGLRSSDGKITLSGGAQPLTLDRVQRLLPAGAQVLSYTVAEQRLMIWLVTRNDFFSTSAEVSADKLRQLTSDYLAELRTRRKTESLDRQAVELYKILISPLTAKLDTNGTLCIVPDGVLAQLPFAALMIPGTGRFLIEDFPLVIAPSASVLSRTLALSGSKPSNSAKAFLGIGNPRFNHQRFPGLPALSSAEDEIAQAKSLYPRALSFNREHATESAIINRLGEYEIVHIAAHALIDEESPLHSSIVLAEEKVRDLKAQKAGPVSPDGKLHAHEIFKLKLARTRLVILSACRSALGSHTRAESLSALAQAFLAAGANSVIASLWDVDDRSTSELMKSFHQYHGAKQQAFGEALRQAQIGMIHHTNDRWRHPYYWAAFIITGDGLSSDIPPSIAGTPRKPAT